MKRSIAILGALAVSSSAWAGGLLIGPTLDAQFLPRYGSFEAQGSAPGPVGCPGMQAVSVFHRGIRLGLDGQ